MLSKLLTLAFALLGLIQVPAQSPRLTRPVKIGGDSGAYRVLLLADGAIVAEGTFPTSTETSEHLVVLDVHGRIIPRLPQEVVSVLAALADGSLLAWVSVTNKFQVHHLKPDGSLDLEFAARFGTNSIGSALPQPDGKILAIGNFDGRSSQLRRIQPDGSLDRDFRDHLIAESQLSEVWGVTVQLDGRIVVQNGSSLHTIRLLADGTRDSSFQPSKAVAGLFADAQSFALPDGKLLLVWGGQLGVARVVDGVVCYGMARLNSDGSLDSTFLFSADTFANAEAPAYAAAKSFSNANLLPNAVLTSDGKIYLSLDWGRRPPGVFGQAGSIHRLLPDGELDTSFRSNHDTHYERQLAPQKDGRLLVLETLRWGWDSPQPSTLKRLNADGTLDRMFNSSELERSFEVGYVQITAIALTTGANYTLQSSEDLIHWEDEQSFTPDSDQYTIGARARSVIKFYRLVGQP